MKMIQIGSHKINAFRNISNKKFRRNSIKFLFGLIIHIGILIQLCGCTKLSAAGQHSGAHTYTTTITATTTSTIAAAAAAGNNALVKRDLGCPVNCSCLGDYLDCIKLNLKIVPDIPDWIQSLELSHNKLNDDINKSIVNLTRLVELKLNKNQIKTFPIFTGLTSLETLQLSNNKIKHILPEALIALSKLNNLDLSRNQIVNILSNAFPQQNQIQHLNLNYNSIQVLDKNAFVHLKQMTDLKLNHNLLQILPNRLFRNMRKLKRMDLSDNQFSQLLWSTFKNLTELRILKLQNNNIQNLTTGVFHGLNKLAVLELDNNYLTSLSKDGLFNLTTLNSISLSKNLISKININTWEFSQHLINIDLSSNNLTTIDRSTFECLEHLKHLNLNNNQIESISDGSFNCTTNLEFLDLSNNRISWTVEDIDSPFSVLRKLDRFQIAGNNIRSVNENALSGLVSLSFLNLSKNNISHIQQGAFTKTPALKELLLNTTAFVCDCDALWLYNSMYTYVFSKANIVCGFPLNLKGKKLQSLKNADFTCDKTSSPQIIDEPPQTMLAITGTNHTLSCVAMSNIDLDMVFKWKRDNSVLNESLFTNTKVDRKVTSKIVINSTLLLSNVGKEHAGRYQCIVSNTFGSVYSQKIKVTVASFPRFQKVPANLTLNSSSTARLDCAAEGDPHPQIAWQKDGGNDFPAARERRMHVMPADDAFFIINAKISDQGVYTCTAENPAGIIRVNVTLTINEAPSFVKQMENREVTTGKSSVIECMASGSPKPTLFWYKDDELIVATERHFFAADEQLLIIVETTLDDAGTYKCEMANILGRKSGWMQLKVRQAASANFINVDEMTGIVIITVVCCAVGTSIIWVVIIYQTKKGNGCTSLNESNIEQTAKEDGMEFRDFPAAPPINQNVIGDCIYEHESLLSPEGGIKLNSSIVPTHSVTFVPHEDDADSGNGDSGTPVLVNQNDGDLKSETTISIQSSDEEISTRSISSAINVINAPVEMNIHLNACYDENCYERKSE